MGQTLGDRAVCSLLGTRAQRRWVQTVLCTAPGGLLSHPSQSRFVDLFGYDEKFPTVKWLEEGGLFLTCSHHFD